MSFQPSIPLNQLLAQAGIVPMDLIGCEDVPIAGVGDHAQTAVRHGLFLARRGPCTDSHQLIDEAIRHGVSAVLVDRPKARIPGVTIVQVQDARRATGLIAHAWHNNPARRMLTLGVTGTNGKTSVTHLVESILQTAGMRTGLLGTLAYRWGAHSIPATNTTPSALALASMFAEMEAEKIDAVVMEVSSHAIDQERITGIPFRVGALTNCARDHLDYHGSLANYVAAKRDFFFKFLAPVAGSTAIFNADDALGQELIENYPEAQYSFTMNPESAAAVRACDFLAGAAETRFRLEIEGEGIDLVSPLIGLFNVQNMLTAAGMAHALGIDPRTIAEGLRRVRSVPGRFEAVNAGQEFRVVVDFAHTPAALESVLSSARRITRGRLITVFGCGGQRDAEKRPLMGQVVGRLSDLAILANDNPRKEDPERIARQAHEGLLASGIRPNRIQVLLDRRKAIEEAVRLARPEDTVVIAGRGAERFQDLGTQVVPFDDREAAAEAITRMLKEKWISATTQRLAVEADTASVPAPPLAMSTMPITGQTTVHAL